MAELIVGIVRLGQKHAKIRIVNLHYEGTVETDVYMALRRRIHLFESVVGRLQPILAKMFSVITGHVLGNHTHDPEARAALTGELEQQAEQAKREGFDLDAMLDGELQEPPRPMPKTHVARPRYGVAAHRFIAARTAAHQRASARFRDRVSTTQPQM